MPQVTKPGKNKGMHEFTLTVINVARIIRGSLRESGLNYNLDRTPSISVLTIGD